MNWPSHGANPQYLYEQVGIKKPENLIDFSANINPLGPPAFLKEKWLEFYDVINQYPDPYGLKLRNIIAEREEVSTQNVILGNGGAELIALVGRLLAGKQVLIVEPAFSEYEQVCQSNGCVISYHLVNEDTWDLSMDSLVEKLSNVQAVFLCNPNNPTGVYYRLSTVRKLAEVCREHNVYLIIDEAFYDFLVDYEKTVPLLKEYSNLLILRSMTKMFGIPGIRLGYALGNTSLLEKITAFQPHWSVNGLAMMAGEECYKDEVFLRKSVDYIRNEREKIIPALMASGYQVSPSQVNFYLLRDPELDNQFELFEFLLKKGLVPRHTMNFPVLEGKWLRFAIKSNEENDVLMEALLQWKKLH
ncbi:threonine-phosphate decarboxylase CobD [Bacillus dakarensis]|uniref:threonine-phosphate decarboxylase CobD n=1 Tax=Robertmurraya dakarensis TaxID=1926278 RepID=UPI0009811258|nr:threonine-phosphate decarboxylase CobD [Bacillus dakarensis]